MSQFDLIVIGAGPGGICAGIKLKEAGHDAFTIVEQTDGVGGTWRRNTYPGCRWTILWINLNKRCMTALSH